MVGDAVKELNFTECEAMLRQVRDVLSVNIVAGENKEILEIHVLADNSRSAKQIVRDIETLFQVEYKMDLDHKKVSVVQVDKKQETFLNQHKRLKFSSISFSLQGDRMKAGVEISSPQKSGRGEKAGSNCGANRLRIIAAAAIAALESFLGEGESIILEDVVLISIAGQEAVCLAATYMRKTAEESLIGCAFVKRDEKESVVRALLCALNRRLPSEL